MPIRHAIRMTAAATLVALAAIVALSAPAASARNGRQLLAARACQPVTVKGTIRQQAVRILRARGCRAFVSWACAPRSQFGKVIAQAPPVRGRVNLRVGKICEKPPLSPNPTPGPSTGPTPSDYGGTYSATFTVTGSNTPLAQVGQQLTGLTFAVQNGRLSGDITGTIDASGHSNNASANLLGFSCPGTLSFTISGTAATFTGTATCTSGSVTVTGTVAGQRTST
jgi:hypothetical protein